MNSFEVSGKMLEFENAPAVGARDGLEKYQVDARDSSGNIYVYAKSTIKRSFYVLTYICETYAKVKDALTFFENDAAGQKLDVTWTDSNSSVKIVRYRKNTMTWRRISNAAYAISFEIEEVI